MRKECIITSDFEGDVVLTRFVKHLQNEVQLLDPDATLPRLSGRVTIVRPFYENKIIRPIALASIKTG